MATPTVKIRHNGGNWPADPSVPVLAEGTKVGPISITELEFPGIQDSPWSSWTFTKGTATFDGTNTLVPVVLGSLKQDGREPKIVGIRSCWRRGNRAA